MEGSELLSAASRYERMDIPVPFLHILYILLDGEDEPHPADRAQYRPDGPDSSGGILLVYGASVRMERVWLAEKTDLKDGIEKIGSFPKLC